ncbi:MAG: VTT domain-containing protein [Candidatus Taylorbacteria bacterium]|nr:VTT domain-containing protein [Candidatus Taylorbacteria bacterium]
MPQYLDPQFLIETLGFVGLVAIVFAESGLFFGFFLPGDSLLFTAGLFASQGHLSIAPLLVTLAIAAIAGDSVGYMFGKRAGPAIFRKEDSLFFHKKHVARAKAFYDRYGVKTIVLARFVPIVRTFAPIVAGVAGMEYKTFLKFNIVGGILWTASMTLLGYVLGATVPGIGDYLEYIIVGIILLSFVPVVREYLKERKASNRSEL